MRSVKPRPTRTSTLANVQTVYQPPPPTMYQPPMAVSAPSLPLHPPNPPRPPLPTQTQALHSTYTSRLKTGVTLLVQPIFASTSSTTTRAARRAVNYTEPGSGDEFPDAGALDSDDSDFVASGGTRMSIRQSRGRMGTGMGVFNAATGVSSTPRPAGATPKPEKPDLDKSYLGMMPPAQANVSRPMLPTVHEYQYVIHSSYTMQKHFIFYSPPDALERQAQRKTSLVPIRVEFETETHRIRDCFVWNVNEMLIKPETFAHIFCNDLEIPEKPWADTIAAQIRTQLEEYEGVASMELGMDGAMDVDVALPNGEETPECRVILSVSCPPSCPLSFHDVDSGLG